MIPKFEGYARKASPEDMELVRHLMDFIKRHYAVRKNSFIKESNGLLDENAFGVNKPALGEEAFRWLSKRLYNFFTKPENGRLARLEELPSWMHSSLRSFFPILGDYFGREEPDADHIFRNIHAPSSQGMADFLEWFRHGAYVYRYARNAEEIDKVSPRFARGIMRVEYSKEHDRIRFSVEYSARARYNEGEDVSRDIFGFVYMVNTHLFFVGTETNRRNPFIMVLPSDQADTKKGGLILRHHPFSETFFASKVFVVRLTDEDGGDELEIANTHAAELPELDQKMIEDLLNASTNAGKGLLFFPGYDPTQGSKRG